MPYISTKTFTHNQGLSCAFRQWRAMSHCRFLHGYALKVEISFIGELDLNGWVQDFGGLKDMKKWLEDTFDHKTIIAMDDPQGHEFERLSKLGLCDLVVLAGGVGCERFAKLIFDKAVDLYESSRVTTNKVQVWEHEGNSAIYEGGSDAI